MYEVIRVLFLWLIRMHLNAGGRDLDNQFFLDLATPSKWVSSTVCTTKNWCIYMYLKMQSCKGKLMIF